jgi:SAM-dependent methyltransferase
MRSELLQWLRCPKTGQAFTLNATETNTDGSVQTGTLCCEGSTVEIVRGIPRFVAHGDYANNFDFEWHQYRLTQLDSHTGNTETRNTWELKTGWQVADLGPDDVVLEVGCGAGRFLEVLAPTGATLIGVDLSGAIDAAQANVGHYPNVHLIQADVFALPLRQEVFSHIYSIGVLHHTPSTQKAFEQLPPLLQPGGQLAVWLYRKRTWVPKTLTHLLRWYTRSRGWTEPQFVALAQTLDKYWYPLVKQFKWQGAYPLRGLLLVSVHPNPEWRRLNNFDAYAPPYNHQHTPQEVITWFQAAGLDAVTPLPYPTSVQGQKPGPRLTKSPCSNRPASVAT